MSKESSVPRSKYRDIIFNENEVPVSYPSYNASNSPVKNNVNEIVEIIAAVDKKRNEDDLRRQVEDLKENTHKLKKRVKELGALVKELKSMVVYLVEDIMARGADEVEEETNNGGWGVDH
ncbi:hypothetical protein BDQ17DRAFT_1356424 [Cyathus striatus]|nr:hypothetical protein BDQ17DRAFT_1378472 [Cyathus striatus]KAF9002989.1 hypothetical protein BDQ17DRAFT_1356424 [Cyathus striatus]